MSLKVAIYATEFTLVMVHGTFGITFIAVQNGFIKQMFFQKNQLRLNLHLIRANIMHNH